MYAIGYDLGSSSIKAALLDIENGKIISSATYPENEMRMDAPKPGWAEQHPEDWWTNIKAATNMLDKQKSGALKHVKAIGITYQMHGLVPVDKEHKVLRPSIIWCDGRAAETGERAAKELGEKFCLENFLNLPGNFTAAKLRWIQENEPDVYKKIFKIMLPGDYIAMKLSGDIVTTVSGLSEGIFWNFRIGDIAHELLNHWNIDPVLLADTVDTFSQQGVVSAKACEETGIPEGTPVTYRAGDQPNNAFSLNVLEPGDIAATAGTSGVVYGILDKPSYDPTSRVNTFVHVNYSPDKPRYGVLLCVNGTGILNSWMRKNFFSHGDGTISYDEINKMAGEIPPGAGGISVFPFGNGAERILVNKDPGASIHRVSFNRHDIRHIARAGQEGIVFALAYGVEVMQEMGIKLETVKAGKGNMFMSPVFREVFVNTTKTRLELYDTDGAEGAARGGAYGAGLYSSFADAFKNLELTGSEEPAQKLVSIYEHVFGNWKMKLKETII